jgi:hypothetical protein
VFLVFLVFPFLTISKKGQIDSFIPKAGEPGEAPKNIKKNRNRQKRQKSRKNTKIHKVFFGIFRFPALGMKKS